MHLIPITIFYAGLYGILMAILSIRVSFERVRTDIAFGDGGNPRLFTRMRVFGNFTEYMPLMLVQFLILELSYTRPLLLHGIGTGLLLLRALHALSLSAEKDSAPWRRMGRFVSALGTWLILVMMSLLLLKPYIARIF
jgi:uncharacterized membrane protein YecN with MAPEG domain